MFIQAKKTATAVATSVLTVASVVSPVFAADDTSDIPNPNSFFSPITPGDAGIRITDFGKLLQGLLNLVMFVAALLVFGYLIWGGIQWITSGGDKGKTEEARNRITAAIVGLAILAASYAIFQLVLYVLGIANPLTGGAPENIKLY
jgi:amino acid transporter